jgi:predicted RNase H-like nuclease
VRRLLDAARSLAGAPVDLITIDMPVATVPFSTRRVADDAISAQFGSRWCSTHTPNASRPGPLGARLSSDVRASGYELATTATPTAKAKRLIEVYPHPALLSLMKRARRVPYKVSKSRKYWPGSNVGDRISALLVEFEAIYCELTRVFGPLGLELPARDDVANLTRLKRYEDALDALTCAWVGVEYLQARTVAFGDETAVIWCPADVCTR